MTDAHLFNRNSQPQLYKQTIRQLQKENVDCIIDCGDLTDHNIINSAQSEILYDIFSNVEIPMHIVMGNHDSLSGVSLASVLKINKNIVVHNDIELQDNMLFVPYINNMTELKQKLDNLNMTTPVSCAFSHLNLTSNFYATIPFEKSKFLHKYSDVWFNGHIHTYEENKTLYGNIFNIGSFSSLTFSDEHIPKYYIYNVSDNELTSYIINGSIIHKTIIINNIEDLSFLGDCSNSNNMKINWRIKLPTNYSFENRNKIKEQLYSLDYTNSVQFDYSAGKQQQTIKINKNQNQTISLIDQLFKNYEQETGCILDKDIKQQLKEE